MKRIIFILLISLVALPSFAQEQPTPITAADVDPRIVEVFGNDLQTLVLNDPHRLRALNQILFERHEIIVEPYTSGEKYTKLSTIPLFKYSNPNLERDTVFDRDTFNILKYDLQFYAPSVKIYRVDNTDFLIVVHPQTLRK